MLARALYAEGHDVLLFCQAGSPLAEWTKDAPFAVDRSMNLNRLNPAVLARGIGKFRRAIREFRPDVLNPHCPPGHSYLALARAFERSSTPLIRTVAEPRPPKQNAVNRLLHERKTQGLIFTTASSERRYRDSFTLDRVPMQTILPGFHADEFAAGVGPNSIRGQLGLAEEIVLFGIIARMSPEKGQEILLRALSLLEPETRSKCHFVLSGDDSRERGARDLMNMADALGVRELLTFQERYADVRPLIAALDVGLITSVRSEAVCRIALEYMSFCKPIVSSDVNILPEVVVDGRNGWTFRYDDPAHLARCLRSAVGEATERTRRGRAGYEMVRSEFSMRTNLESTLAFYHRILNSRTNT